MANRPGYRKRMKASPQGAAKLLNDINSIITSVWNSSSYSPKRMIVATDRGPIEFGEGIELNAEDQVALDRAFDIALGPAEPKES